MKRVWRICTAVLLIFLAGVLCGAGRAAAQALPTMKRPGAYIAVGGGYSLYQLNYGDRQLGGATAWVDVNIRPHYGLEGETRWLFMNKANPNPSITNVHASTWLGGVRVNIRRPYGISPYVKLLGGIGQFTFVNNYATGSYFVAAPGAGLDVSVGHKIRIRVVDVEYQIWPQFTYGDLHSAGVTTGFSYSFF
jgi:hypothetical protein